MPDHNSNCENFNYFVHCATGGDGECVCDVAPEDISVKYANILFGTPEENAIFAAELGIDIDESRNGVIG